MSAAKYGHEMAGLSTLLEPDVFRRVPIEREAGAGGSR